MVRKIVAISNSNMFEHRSQPLISKSEFISRAFRYALFSATLIGSSLIMGMAGYHFVAGISWVDAFYNASMILTGMGPALDINLLPANQQDATRIFAGLYALYSGVVFLAATGLALSPLLHRFFHKLHLDLEE